jgi:ABC-type sugar transport system ATPase subunit
VPRQTAFDLGRPNGLGAVWAEKPWHGTWKVAAGLHPPTETAILASIRFDGVWKRYGGLTAVEDLNLTCPEGEMLALLGPSGCGKSSTIKMAAGVEEVSSGEILLGERPVSNLGPKARNVAMVFEDYALYPHMSVRENVTFPLTVRGLPSVEAKARADSVLDLLGLHQIADRGVSTLSGGAQQRVAIGRALVRDPDLILFDEPLSHLDADQKVHLRGEIKRLQKLSAVTSILVTHDQTEATAMADRIAVMKDGVLQQVATPQELYARPANMFVARFIGEPPMNLLPLRQDAGRLTVADTGWPLPLDERRRRLAEAAHADLVAGVRPERVTIEPGDAAGLPAIVDYREPRGDVDVIIASAQRGGTVIVAEIPGPSRYRTGDHVSIALSESHIHLFGGSAGRNLDVPA